MAEPGPGFAPAKVNLTLHVTGQRPDGYHLIDSLVVFAAVGDHISLTDAPGLVVNGPLASGVPTDRSNLVLRAAELFPEPVPGVSLEKRLPAAAGIGGGSSDAAALIRLMVAEGQSMPPDEAILSLGADVPVCLAAPQPMRMRGIGEKLHPVQEMPNCWLVLVNPGLEVPTSVVFSRLENKNNPGMGHGNTHWPDAGHFADWLSRQRNDLEQPAIAVQPAIAEVLSEISACTGCLLSRMSGSGATCFGLFASAQTARSAASVLERPGWWVKGAPILRPQSRADQFSRETK